MNGSIISLIQENRKLFYRGILKNSYKTEITKSESGENETFTSTGKTIKEKSFRLIQEIFNE